MYIEINFLGWSWCDITLTPPATAIYGDPKLLAQDLDTAKSNFLKMSTFKPPTDENASNVDETQV